MKKCKILKNYKTQYHNPITLQMGAIVKLGKEETKEKWKGWIWAESITQKGWIPMQLIAISVDRKQGVLLDSYTAKELTISKNSFVLKINTINGWSWCKNILTDEEGWLPDEILLEIETKKEKD